MFIFNDQIMVVPRCEYGCLTGISLGDINDFLKEFKYFVKRKVKQVILILGKRSFTVFLDIRVRAVIVDTLKIFRFNTIPEEVHIFVELLCDISHNIFYKHRVLMGFFGNIFFVHPLQERIYLPARRFFYEPDEILYPEKFFESYLHCYHASLIVCAYLADFLGTGTYGSYRDNDTNQKIR